MTTKGKAKQEVKWHEIKSIFYYYSKNMNTQLTDYNNLRIFGEPESVNLSLIYSLNRSASAELNPDVPHKCGSC